MKGREVNPPDDNLAPSLNVFWMDLAFFFTLLSKREFGSFSPAINDMRYRKDGMTEDHAWS